jgi:hypothetical protein
MRKKKILVGEDDALEYIIKWCQTIENRLERMEHTMATRAELNTGLDGVVAAFGPLTDAINTLKAAIASGADFQPELDKVTAIGAAIQAAISNAQL